MELLTIMLLCELKLLQLSEKILWKGHQWCFETGLDFRFGSSHGKWGCGTYFAVQSSYSTHHAHHNGSICQILLALVLTGRRTCMLPDSY